MKIEDFKNKNEEFLKPPGIIGSDECLKASVLIALVPKGDEYFFLFEKRDADIRQGGEVCFPGGLFDANKDKNLEDTAVRETIEELGISSDKINIIGRHDTLFAPQAGITIESFVGILDIENVDELTLSKDEVSEVFLIPVSYFENTDPAVFQTRLLVEPDYINSKGEKVTLFPAKELGLPERYHKPWGKNRVNVYLYDSEPERVWGFTARLIISFLKRLDGVKID